MKKYIFELISVILLFFVCCNDTSESVVKFNRYRDQLVNLELTVHEIWNNSLKDEGATYSDNISLNNYDEADEYTVSFQKWVQQSDEQTRFNQFKETQLSEKESKKFWELYNSKNHFFDSWQDAAFLVAQVK